MSYAHTKRRKTIARLKRKFPKDWRNKLLEISDAVRKSNDGPLIGSLQDILGPPKTGNAFRDAMFSNRGITTNS